MKIIFTYLILFSFSVLFSQEKLSKSFQFKTDNDLYASFSKDRYYTSGIFLTYSYLSKKTKEHLEKTIYKWEIGHQMYNPFKALVKDIDLHDRPFASYLYGSVGIQQVYKNNQIFTTRLQLGVIGPAAYGKELQSFIHTFFNFDEAVGWKHQIKNALGINLNLSHHKFLTNDAFNHFDLSWSNTAKIGTIFTNVSTGIFARIGLIPLQEMKNSIAFDTGINNLSTNYKREREAFFYAKTTVHYSFYDATLQGSFLNKGSEVTSQLIPLHFGLEFGIMATIKRFNLGYAYLYNSQKSQGLHFTNGNYYGSIQLSYLFN